MARADRYTHLTDLPEYYSDFMTNFATNPITDNLAKITNEDAIKQALKNLILTVPGERPDVRLGSGITSMLFEPANPVTAEIMKIKIQQAIDYACPRVNVKDITVIDDIENNSYTIVLWFEAINIPEPVRLDLLVKRVR